MKQSCPVLSLTRCQKELAERNLLDFIRLAWPIVEPGTDYISGRHIDAIALHLEAVSRGEIRNLLINIPPRCGKSRLVSVFWPVWTWISRPETRWLFSSYSGGLAIRDSLACRRIIESLWYQERWGDRFELTGDQNAKARFENDRTGYRLSTSVGGAATGEGGDFVIVDDPHNVQEGDSEAMLEATTRWWDEVMTTRLNNPNTGAKVVIMQRVSAKDLSAHLLDKGGYEHLCLPMEYETDRKCSTSIGWTDWRTTEGELLWPERIGKETLEKLKNAMGSYASAGQLQQRPSPRGGGLFKPEWFEIVSAAPASTNKVRCWDRAATDNDGDYTVGLLLSRVDPGVCYVEDVVRFQGTPLAVERAIANTAARDGLSVRVIIPEDPGSAGKSEAGATIRALAGYMIKAVRASGSKEQMAGPVISQAEAGNVKIVRAPWNSALLDELSTFNHGAHDDQVDALSGAFNALAASFRVICV